MAYTTIENDKDGSEEITITNIDKDLYPTETISTDPFQKMKEGVHWINYFLCGYKAILAHNKDIYGLVKKPAGMKILIDSHVPPASGLSSSSAFTVCAAITTMHANNIVDKVSLGLLAELTINAERMAGTACGGMD
jgi:galactokinase